MLFCCLPPHGGSGLKYLDTKQGCSPLCLPPHGGSGLKLQIHSDLRRGNCLPPHGGSGLKYLIVDSQYKISIFSLPTEGVDLNFSVIVRRLPVFVSLPTEGVDLNSRTGKSKDYPPCLPPHGGSGFKYRQRSRTRRGPLSPSPRREWI